MKNIAKEVNWPQRHKKDIKKNEEDDDMYQFTEDCLIGIEEIDKEHRHLFELINHAMELLQKETAEDKRGQIQGLMKELQDYTETHFSHEETYMEKIQDPELPRQKKQHEEFRAKIHSLDTVSLEEEGGQEKLLEELLQYLVRWLYHHILGSDIMIGKIRPISQGKEEDPCAFTPEYYTGIEMVDQEHKTLFDIIGSANRLVKAELLHDKYDEIVGILNRLRDYTEEHFRDEEEYMEKMQYSRIDAQKRAHAAFVDKLYEIDLDDVDDNQQTYLEELMDFLFGWLTNHILMSDKLIGQEAGRKDLL